MRSRRSPSRSRTARLLVAGRDVRSRGWGWRACAPAAAVRDRPRHARAVSPRGASAAAARPASSSTDAEVAELVARTEGWPAGLYLAALTLRGRNASADRPVSITGEDRYVAEYLRSEHLVAARAGHACLPAALVRARQDVRLAVRRRPRDRGVRGPARVDARVEPVPRPARRPLRVVPLPPPVRGAAAPRARPAGRATRSPRSTAGRRTGTRRTASPRPRSSRRPSPATWIGSRGSSASVALPTVPRRPPDGDRGLARPLPRRGAARPVPRRRSARELDPRAARPAGRRRAVAAADRGRLGRRPLPDGSASARPWIAVLRAAMCRDGVEQMRVRRARTPSSSCPRTASCARRPWLMHGAAHVLLGDAEHGDLILAIAADEAERLERHATRLVALSERSLVAGARGDHAAGGRARVRGARSRQATLTWTTIRRPPSSWRCAHGRASARAGGTRPGPISQRPTISVGRSPTRCRGWPSRRSSSWRVPT